MKNPLRWSATSHAIKRARERFNVRGSDVQVTEWLAHKLDAASFIGCIPDDSGKMRRAYTSGKVVIFVAIADNAIITVREASVQKEWRGVIERLADKELRKHKRRALAEERKLLELRSQMETEVCELRSAALGARSDAKRNACHARVNALTMRITEVERDINRVRRDVLKAAESYAAVI